jgi:hypothetical protein
MSKHAYQAYPMRVQALTGSEAERRYYDNSALPGSKWPAPKAIAPGMNPSPLDDLMYHGGKIVPESQFQNVYLGGNQFGAGDIESIEAGITRAMSDKAYNNVLAQYFVGKKTTCDALPALILDAFTASFLDEPQVQETIVQLFDEGRIADRDLPSTIFNLVLPPGAELRLAGSSSHRGLGGYHGSLHIDRGGKRITLYYSANVYSSEIDGGRRNGIVVFDKPWKNVVATLCHEIDEFRTDPDVNDAIESGSNDFLGWTSRFGHECGDQPIARASSLELVFAEISTAGTTKKTPVQFMYSNSVHGAEGPIPQPASLLSPAARQPLETAVPALAFAATAGESGATTTKPGEPQARA